MKEMHGFSESIKIEALLGLYIWIKMESELSLQKMSNTLGKE